jgi:hypothetical protein
MGGGGGNRNRKSSLLNADGSERANNIMHALKTNCYSFQLSLQLNVSRRVLVWALTINTCTSSTNFLLLPHRMPHCFCSSKTSYSDSVSFSLRHSVTNMMNGPAGRSAAAAACRAGCFARALMIHDTRRARLLCHASAGATNEARRNSST